MTDEAIGAWLTALIERHARGMTRPEFLKAIRALSARYVERRGGLERRSAIDTAGKRAAFAAFYAALHFLTVRAIARQLAAGSAQMDTITDLGCGTGVASAAWAIGCTRRPVLCGLDVNEWALAEALWNWRALGLHGRTRRADLVTGLDSLGRESVRAPERDTDDQSRAGMIAAWSLNELDPRKRTIACARLIELARRGSPIVIVEPIAARLVPWWAAWARQARDAGGRADEWKLETPLPALLAELDEAAGFRREGLSARSVSFNL